MLFSCRIYWGLLFPGSKNIVGEVGRSWWHKLIQRLVKRLGICGSAYLDR
jgi:hypothetical protein